MTEGCTLREYSLLYDIEALKSKIYIYNHHQRSATHPADQEIPWTVYLILGAFSRKHIFRRGNLPDLQKISDGIMDLGNRIKWISILGANEAPIPWWRKKTKIKQSCPL